MKLNLWKDDFHCALNLETETGGLKQQQKAALGELFYVKSEINLNNWFHKNLSNTEAPYPILTPANEGADEMFASVLVFSMVEEWMNKSELYLRRRDIFQNEH